MKCKTLFSLVLLIINISVFCQIPFYISKQTGEYYPFPSYSGYGTKTTDQYENGCVLNINSTGPILWQCNPADFCININQTKSWTGWIKPDVSSGPEAGKSANATLSFDYDVHYSRPIELPGNVNTTGCVIFSESVEGNYSCTNCPYHSDGGVHNLIHKTGSCTQDFIIYSIFIEISDFCLELGNTTTLAAYTYPAGIGNITWTESNSNISISGSGNSVSITGNSLGITTITAKLKIAGVTYTSSCDVYILPNENIYNENETFNSGPSYDLKFYHYPSPSVSIEGRFIPEDNFSGRSKTKYGLGEIIYLGKKIDPAYASGKFHWKIISGGGELTSIHPTNGKAIYKCPFLPGKVKLKIFFGNKCGKTYTIDVIAPSDAWMKMEPGTVVGHLKGTVSVGFFGEFYLLPKNVSFKNLEFQEGFCHAKAKGYYKKLDGIPHLNSKNPLIISGGNISTGCKVKGHDKITSGAMGKPYKKGSFKWPIPWEYIYDSKAKEFTKAIHFMKADKKGKATIEKKGEGPHSKKPSDPNSQVGNANPYYNLF